MALGSTSGTCIAPNDCDYSQTFPPNLHVWARVAILHCIHANHGPETSSEVNFVQVMWKTMLWSFQSSLSRHNLLGEITVSHKQPWHRSLLPNAGRLLQAPGTYWLAEMLGGGEGMSQPELFCCLKAEPYVDGAYIQARTTGPRWIQVWDEHRRATLHR